MDMMKAVLIHEHGGPEVLELAQVPKPEPGPGQALVRVGAVSVNSFLDIANRAGRMNYRTYAMPNILGSEHAGELVAVGPDTRCDLPLGSRVAVVNVIPCGTCRICQGGRPHGCPDVDIIGVSIPGAYAEYTVVPVANLLPVPAHVSFEQAAGMNTLGPLATQQLIEGRAAAGMTVLIQGAASGTGVMAACVARALGLRVYGTTRSPSKVDQLVALGLFDAVVDTSADDPASTLESLTDGRGMDIIIDNIGEPTLWELTLAALAPMGTVAISGAKFGGQLTIDSRRLYQMGQRIVGLRIASPEARREFWEMVNGEQIIALVDRVFSLDEVADAHRYVESGENIGRSVISLG